MTDTDPRQITGVVQGRSCGSCTLCCKVFRIQELSKPAGLLCSRSNIETGLCTDYQNRPSACRDFLCAWLIAPGLGEAWHPVKSKMAVHNWNNAIVITVDPDFPLKWKEEPYYSQIKGWANLAVDNGGHMLVCVGTRITIVFPNKEVDLGEQGPGDRIMTFEKKGPNGRDWDASIQKANAISEDTDQTS